MEQKYIHPSKKKAFILLSAFALIFYFMPLCFDYLKDKFYEPFAVLMDLNCLLSLFNGATYENYYYTIYVFIGTLIPNMSSISIFVSAIIIPLLSVASIALYIKNKAKPAVTFQICFLAVSILTLVASMVSDLPGERQERPVIFAIILPILIISAIVIGLKGLSTATTEKPIVAQKVEVVNTNATSVDEIKKYKELLDEGIITQEEFDAKKKQLLSL